jgi:integrase
MPQKVNQKCCKNGRKIMKPEGYLVKRGQIWHAIKTIGGEKCTWSAKTGDKALAKRRAMDHWRAVVAKEHELVDRQASKRPAVATLGEIQAAYLGWATTRPNRATRRQNANMLRSVCRLGLGEWDPRTPVTRLTGRMVEQFQRARVASVADQGEEAIERAKFSANSMLVQARAVFRSAVPWQAAGLLVPGLESFRRAERLHSVAIDTEFRPFTAAELKVLGRALPRLRFDQPAVWITAVLMLYGGLRNSEVGRAQRSWIVSREVRGVQTSWCSVQRSKTARGVRMVPLPDWVAEGVLELAGPDWLIAAAHKTERKAIVERAINEWVRANLPGRTAYDFRRQAGSWVLDEQGLQAAADFLGHTDSQTTLRWYASRVRALLPVSACRPLELSR